MEGYLVRFGSLPSLPLIQLFRRLAQDGAARPDGARPIVSLILAGGRELRGWVLACQDDPAGARILLVLDSQSRTPPSDVAYLPVASILAATVHSALEHVRTLGGADAGGPAAARAQPRRSPDEHQRRLSTHLGRAVGWTWMPPSSADPEAMRALAAASERLLEAVLVATGDPARKAAFLSRVRAVELREGLETVLTLDRATLSFRLPAGFGVAALPTVEKLRASIETML